MKQAFNFVEFVAVVQTGSFSKAALKLGVSKSHVSKKITQLEQHLGVQLLHRSTRKLVMTEIGEIYYQRCKKILDDIFETESMIMESKIIPQGVLNISMPATLGEQLLIPLLSELMLQNRGLTVNAQITSRTVDIIEEGMDLVIRLGHLPDSNLKARKIGKTRWIVCASPAYLDKYGTPNSPDELQQHHCLVFGLHGFKHEMAWEFSSIGKKRTFRINPVLISNNGAALIAAARKGVGITFLPEFFSTADLSEDKLQHILVDCYQEMPISAIYPYRHYLLPKVRLCIDFLVASLNQ